MLDKQISIPIHREEHDGKLCSFFISAMLEIHQLDIEKYSEDMYFSYDGHIYIILKSQDEKLFINNRKFVSDYDLSNNLTLYIFKMNESDSEVFNVFFLGSWSNISKEFINKLKQFSKLNFGKVNKEEKLKRVYSIPAAAILKLKSLKNALEEYLQADISNDAELMQEPSNKNYITLDELFSKYTIDELE
jgi:hypothetical protein